MAFVNEELTKQDKEFIASFKFTQPIGRRHELAYIPLSWTADRERNMFLICLGGQGYRYSEECPPDYYRLIIDNAVISIEGMFRNVGSYSEGLRVTWKIIDIVVPKKLNHLKSEEVLEIVKEVFLKHSFRNTKNVISVKFDFIANPIFKKN